MKKAYVYLFVVGLVLVLMAGEVFAQSTDTESLTVNAVVAPRATLTIGSNVINFADQDPDTVPSISATEGPVAVRARVRTGRLSAVTLTHTAVGNLTSPAGDTIPIGSVTWTAAGGGFVNGAMSTGGSSAGAWTGSGDRNSTFSYFLANSWSYAAGSYTVATTYTLTAP